MLVLVAMANSFAFDWLLQLRVRAHVDQFMLARTPTARLSQLGPVVQHGSLRLASTHAAFGALWQEQLGIAWREPQPPLTWPVLDGDDARWAVRAAIDAVVADAYGLSRERYAYVLSTFSHTSYPKAPDLCLAAFDELKSIGLDAFTRKHDPYWDIPLNENLPQPVIDLPMPTAAPAVDAGPLFAQPQFRGGAELTSAGDLALAAEGGPPPRRSTPGRRPAALDEATFDRLRDLFAERHVLTSADAQQATGLDAAAVRPYLERLVADGLAVREGAARGTRYVAQRRG
jgi:hypothetical protein